MSTQSERTPERESEKVGESQREHQRGSENVRERVGESQREYQRGSENVKERESEKVRESVGYNVSYSVRLQCEAITYVSVE